MTWRDTLRGIATFEPVGATGRDTLAVTQPASEQYQLAAQALSGWQFGKATWPTWDPQRGASEGYARLALIYRCVNIIAHALGTAPVRVYDEANDNETVPDHPMRALMKRPNPRMGEAAFWAAVGTRAAVAGFCVCEKERDGLGNVIGLWPLQSAWLKAIARRDSAHDWEYRIPGIVEPFRLNAEDVIVFRWADTPGGSPYGMGPLEACLREVALANVILDFVKKYVEHGAVPVYALIPDNDAEHMDQTKVDEMLDKFVARHGGLDKATRPVYLQSIKEIVKVGSTLEEMAYTALRDVNELAMIQAFGIPASVAQIRVGLEHSDSRANAEVDEGKLYRQTIIPLWTRWDDALTLGLLTEFEPPESTKSLEFDTSDIQALQEDRNAKATWVNAAVNPGGWMSVHTAHRELGLKVPKGEDYYLRSIAVEAIPATDPMGLSVAPQLPLPPGAKPADDEGLARISDRFVLNLQSILDETRPPQLALQATTRGKGHAARYAKAVNGRKLIARIAEAREPSIHAFFAAQGKRIVPKVTQGLAARGPSETYAMEDIDWDAEDGKLKKVTGQLHQLAGETAFRSIEQQYGIDIGISFDLANPHVKDVVDKLGTRVKDINGTTKDLIANKVSTGLQEGKSISEIADSLSDVFESRARAETVARSEAMTSFGHASALGFRESGVVDRLQLFDNPDHTEDYGASDGLTCAQRDGLIVPLDDAEKHIEAEHPNGSLVCAPVLVGED